MTRLTHKFSWLSGRLRREWKNASLDVQDLESQATIAAEQAGRASCGPLAEVTRLDMRRERTQLSLAFGDPARDLLFFLPLIDSSTSTPPKC